MVLFVFKSLQVAGEHGGWDFAFLELGMFLLRVSWKRYMLIGGGAEMALEYEFTGRDKPIMRHTYPIKRGDLDAALKQAGVTELKDLGYVSGKSDEPNKHLLVSARMPGEAMNGMWMKKTPSLWVKTVPIEVSPKVKALIAKHDLLMTLANWLRGLELAENVRRDQYQYFNAYYEDEKLIIYKTK